LPLRWWAHKETEPSAPKTRISAVFGDVIESEGYDAEEVDRRIAADHAERDLSPASIASMSAFRSLSGSTQSNRA
jgi:hypothetical protein